MADELKVGEDYYFDDKGLMVFTEEYHLKRGSCCQSGCKHCPYGFHDEKDDLEKDEHK